MEKTHTKVNVSEKNAETGETKRGIRQYFTAQRITTLAILAALGYALSFLEFSMFPMTSAFFLKMDFSNVATMLGAYMLGPVAAIVIEGVKQLLCLFTSTSGGVGQLANFLVTVSFVIVPSILYKFKKGLPWVAAGMGIGCVVQICVSLICNRYINYPLFMKDQAAEMFAGTFWLIIAFNAIKGVSISILTLLLYKRLSKAIKWMFQNVGAKTKKSDKAAACPDNSGKSVANPDKEVYNDLMQKIITRSEEETRALARKLASDFKGGEVVLLTGELGAGKTVFAKGVADALGVTEDVKSPTFTLSCEYEGNKLRLIHIDAYRLNSGAEAEACGINERFGDKSCVCLIEWPSKISDILPSKRIEVTILRTGDSEREITINADQ